MGWIAFSTMLLGTFFGMIGGGIGAQFSLRKPLGELDRRALGIQRPAFT